MASRCKSVNGAHALRRQLAEKLAEAGTFSADERNVIGAIRDQLAAHRGELTDCACAIEVTQSDTQASITRRSMWSEYRARASMTTTDRATAVPWRVRPRVVRIHGSFCDRAIDARSREARGDHDFGRADYNAVDEPARFAR